MIHRIVAPLSCALGGLLPAQDEASTLARLAQRADLVVQARAVRATDPDPTVHRWLLELQTSLHGTVADRFELQEPAGRCCGRALHSVVAGGSYLVFLEARAGHLHVLGGERGMEPADAALMAHVRALIDAGSSARVGLLAAALDHPHPRARRDAALALGAEPGLENAGPQARRSIARAAPRLLSAGDTALSAILTAASRLELSAVAADLLPAYLDGRAHDLEGLLLHYLPRLDAEGVCRLLTELPPADPAARLRAVRLLDRIPNAAVRPPLLRLLREGGVSCRTEAAVALLRAGHEADDLQGRVSPSILDEARRRAQRPRFRAIRPGGDR